MLYLARLGLQMAEASLKPRVGLLDESVISLRVWPGDLDLNLHMNNARFLTAMELGRWDLAVRQGWVRAFFKRRWAGLGHDGPSPTLPAWMAQWDSAERQMA